MWTTKTAFRCFNTDLMSKSSSGLLLISRSVSGCAVRSSNIYIDNKNTIKAVPSNFSSCKNFIGCHSLCASPFSRKTQLPPCTRGIIIGKVYEWVTDLSFKDINSILHTFDNSAIVTGTRDMFLWTESTFGLPWWVNIVLTTTIVRTVTYAPVAAYLEHWSASRETFLLDSVPITSRLRSAEGNKQRVRELMRVRRQLITEYNCQSYKFALGLIWQISNMIVLSAGLRQCLLTYGGSGLREAPLPWGATLGFPDTLFILPIVNILLNIVTIEMDAWKMQKKHEELEMTLKRGSMESQGKTVLRNQTRALHIRRLCCVFLLVVYASVPASLTLLWCVMLVQILGLRFALLHPKVRRCLGIRQRCYETTQPFNDFRLHLGKYLQSKSSVKNPS